MPKPPRACLTCGVLQWHGDRCAACHARRQTARKAALDRPHYDHSYRKRAKQVRDNAVVCWLCGGGARANDPWTADHVIPANRDSVLLAAHRSCNSRRGNKPAPQALQAPLLHANPRPAPNTTPPTNGST